MTDAGEEIKITPAVRATAQYLLHTHGDRLGIIHVGSLESAEYLVSDLIRFFEEASRK